MVFIRKMLVVFCFVVWGVTYSEARVVVDVNEGVMKPINIALYLYDGINSIKEQFLAVVGNDLRSTGLFKTIPNDAFMQNLKGVNQIPHFPLWRTINTQYLMNAETRMNNNGQLAVAFILYDVLSGAKIKEFSLTCNVKEWRRAAHLVANAVYERIVGEKGYFDTKILYVAVDKTSRGKKRHRLAMMDQDGYNLNYITDGRNIVLTPRFSPNGNEFSFFAYKEKIVNGRTIPLSASIYRYDIKNKRRLPGIHFKGMTYAPRYSPDGTNLIFSLSEKTKNRRSASSIFKYDLLTNQVKRITDARPYRCIDTSPCYSPDGKFIVFNSDRGGTQQLYIMNSDGSNIRRLSFGKGRYATPVWSPRGDWIAFTRFGRDGFFIGIIRPNDTDGSTERMIASGYLVEGPTWSPNGRVVMYSQQDYSRRERIYSVDITGYNKREIKTLSSAIDPEWSRNTGLLQH